MLCYFPLIKSSQVLTVSSLSTVCSALVSWQFSSAQSQGRILQLKNYLFGDNLTITLYWLAWTGNCSEVSTVSLTTVSHLVTTHHSPAQTGLTSAVFKVLQEINGKKGLNKTRPATTGNFINPLADLTDHHRAREWGSVTCLVMVSWELIIFKSARVNGRLVPLMLINRAGHLKYSQ